MNIFLQSMKKYRVLWIFTAVMLAASAISLIMGGNRQKLVYNQELELVVATIEEESITLREFAVYVAFQEAEVDVQARIYNPENPKQYWGLHTNGQFIKYAARNAAIAMAIHDELFYQLALREAITLTEEEVAVLESDVADFWSDLTDYGKEKALGITRQDVYDSFYKIAYAEKYQYLFARSQGKNFMDYAFAGEEYQELLSSYEYQIHKKVLERIDFGNVTLDY